LNLFEINLIRFENRIGRPVLPTPPVSTVLTASPHCPVPHPTTNDRTPVASRPTCQPRRLASCRPRRSPLPRQCHAIALLHTVPGPPSLSLSLSLSPAPPPHDVHPSGPPSPPLPVKTEPPPADRKNFLTPRVVRLVRPRPRAALSIPSPRRPPQWFSAVRSARGDHTGTRVLQRVVQAVFPAGLGCQAVAQPPFWPTMRGRPPRPVGCSLGPVSAQYCAGDLNVFQLF
jgi:hypothetical protein